MSADANRRLVRRYLTTIWDRGHITAIDEFLSPFYQRHLTVTGPTLDRAGQKQLLMSFRSAFPDAVLEVEELVAEEDLVGFRSVMRGTHGGVFRGIAPTHRPVEVGLVDLMRIEDGQIAEQWGGPDLLDLLKQLGASITPPE